jgi:hypothetical protein
LIGARQQPARAPLHHHVGETPLRPGIDIDRERAFEQLLELRTILLRDRYRFRERNVRRGLLTIGKLHGALEVLARRHCRIATAVRAIGLERDQKSMDRAGVPRFVQGECAITEGLSFESEIHAPDATAFQ